ncbi:beta-hydroxyacyl-ACP dehydratase [Streptosporangium sp. NBC_01755]|uniref:3-hydroxyacyl-ACP dehydratase FabZ family protein n=1 Tax=unclassified Streptosporangium TaxID=2632669 RepID=UPI002DDC0CA0|nr:MULTISPECIES: 3-hydroxyacyl-ACP dehydratase FabZ family protein [unclassified Streptosporangium]WSA27998.1 beta-hydroxyacyl-ACP dehydratase [Streptosporangium sp. NBC_01810]WSD00531.1 beta-hydroxyacyl-ACP dehydratase [Streptosporangium sp. NBC_01755]
MADLSKILPHRYPMLLVDEVLDISPGERITALKSVSRNEPWYRDHVDGPYPEVLLVESWAQAAGLILGVEQPDPDGRHVRVGLLDPDVPAGQVMLLGSLAGIEFHRRVLPGDVLEHRVRVSRAIGETVIFEGECVVRGELVFTVSKMVVAYRPAEQLRAATGGHDH